MAKQNRGCGVMFIAASIILASFFIMIAAACFIGIAEGDFEVLLGGLVIGVPMLVAIFFMARAGLKHLGKLSEPTITSAYHAPGVEAPVAEILSEPGERIVSITTIAGTANPEYEIVPDAPAEAVPAPAPVPMPVPAPVAAPPTPVAAPPTPVAASAPAPSRTGLYTPEPPSSAGYSFEKAVLRSSDVFATLKDFAAHAHENSYDTSLCAMLNAIGISSWQDAPKIEATKLGRSGCFWLGNVPEGLSNEDGHRFLGIESALNVSLAMRRAGCGAQDVLKNVIDLEPLPAKRKLPGVEAGAQEQGEWMARLRFAEFAEDVPAPFRVAFGMQANLADGLFAVDLTIPHPSSMAFIATNRTGCISAARAYALRSALLCARNAFDASTAVTRVVVNCGTRGGESTLLSLGLDRAALNRLITAAHDPAIDQTGFPTDPAIHASFDPEGWFLPVEPFLPIDSEELAPQERYTPVELSTAPASPALAAACGARMVSDLGINEHAGRAEAWHRYISGVGSTTSDAVARLVAIRDAAQDVSVAEAADRVSKALVEGTVDVSDTDALARLFVDGSLLDTVARNAQNTMSDPEQNDIEPLLAPLEDALAPLMSMGVYLDDSDQIYRYFNSLVERAWFNLNLHDGTRAVRLVPDSYYIAHSCAARILSTLDRGDEALVHADELVRIAPATPDAALVKVRVLENMSRIYDAVDLLKETISRCSTVYDLAVCFYRLAYMEWKLGRSDLAVACYERAIMIKTPIADQAKDELADLLESDSSLAHLAEDDVVPALVEAGLPEGDVDELRMLAARAAIATADDNLHGVAAPLTGTLIDAGRDDVLVDIYHSLRG